MSVSNPHHPHPHPSPPPPKQNNDYHNGCLRPSRTQVVGFLPKPTGWRVVLYPSTSAIVAVVEVAWSLKKNILRKEDTPAFSQTKAKKGHQRVPGIQICVPKYYNIHVIFQKKTHIVQQKNMVVHVHDPKRTRPRTRKEQPGSLFPLLI